MRKGKVMMVIAIWLLSSCAIAQSSIDKIVDELEKKGVDVSFVAKRDPKTKQVYMQTKTLCFYSKEGKYANRLKEAFRKEGENAATETYSHSGNNYTLVFKDGKKRYTYTLTITNKSDGNPLVNLAIVFRNNSIVAEDDFWDKFHIEGFNSIERLDSLNLDFDASKWTKPYKDAYEKYKKEYEKHKKEYESESKKFIIIREKVEHVKDSLKNQRAAAALKRSRNV